MLKDRDKTGYDGQKRQNEQGCGKGQKWGYRI